MSNGMTVPDDWTSDTLINIADYHNGAAFKPKDWSEDGLPIVRIEQLNNVDSETDKYNGVLLPNNFIDTGDLIFSWSATLKVIIWNQGPGALNQHLYKVVPKTGINRFLLLYILDFNMNRLAGQSQGSTMKHVTRRELSRFQVIYPKRGNEQQKIATVLRTIDQAIEKTEALIDKYQQIKAGLMHDLFTRGIGADGKLRPPHEQAPEMYQQTPIGWIPKEWNIKSCTDLCSRICVGIVIQPTQYYVDDGVPAFRSANVRENGIDPTNFVYISPASNKLLAKSQVKTGDILSVRTGYPGTSAVVPHEFNGANCIDILISTPNEKITSEYLCNWINSSFGKGQVLRQQGGMAQQHFNVGEMRQLLVALPDVQEQELISNRIKTCADKLKIEQDTLVKLQKQKSGLMHDLLTGKISVQIDESILEPT